MNPIMPTSGYQTGGFYPGAYPYMPQLTNYGSTYSAPSGGTNQGQQLQQLTDLLSKITGAAPQAYSSAQLQPAYVQAQAQATSAQGGANQYAQNIQQQNLQQAGVPGLVGQYGDLTKQFALWQADQGFSNQFSNQSPSANLNPYTNAPLQQASAQGAQQMQGQNQADMAQVGQMTTPNQPGATIATPGPSTPGPISGNATTTANPFLGSTQSIIDSTSNLPTPPSVATSEMGTQMSGATNMLNLINSLIGAETQTAGNATQTDVASYQDKMNVLNTIANSLGSALGTAQAQEQPGGAVSVQNSLNNLQKDVSRGLTLSQLVQKYSVDPNMTADKVYQMYNAFHSQPGDQWGPAKESAQQLADLGITGAPVTQAAAAAKAPQTKTIGGNVMEYNSQTKAYDIPAGGTQAIDQSSAMLDNYLAKWKSMNPIEKMMPSQVTNTIPGAFPDRAYLDTDFFTQIEPLLRKQVVGGRITQQEMTWLRNSLPKAGDSDQSAALKIQAIKDALSGGITKAAGGTGNTGGGSNKDPLGIL